MRAAYILTGDIALRTAMRALEAQGCRAALIIAVEPHQPIALRTLKNHGNS
jgi:hypothetical protein